MAQSRSPEQPSFVVGDHMDLSANADLLDRSYSSNAYNGTSSTSSSKAVLAALRALQDKIRRLEAERSQALDEATQLRHQLKNQEVEAEHAKQRDQLTSQKSLSEVRAAYERLLTDKSELEVRLSKFEEKNKQAQSHVDELQAKIRVLEDEKHAGTMKLKDLDHQRAQIEAQIKLAQQKEEELAQSMVWESKRHEEAVSFNQKRIQSLQDELAELCQEKGMSDAKLMELDQLVGQLLSVNESLVGQLTGKQMKHDVRVKTKKSKTKKVSVPRAATLSTASADAGKVTKFSRRNNSQLIPVMAEDVEALQSMHKMYSKIAKSIKKSVSPIRATKRSSTPSGMSSSGKAKNNTRLAQKKAQLIDQFNEEARSSLEYARHLTDTSAMGRPHSAPSGDHRASSSSSTFTPRSSVEVRLPRADYDAEESAFHLDEYHRQQEQHRQQEDSFMNNSVNHSMSHAGGPHVSFSNDGNMSPVPGSSYIPASYSASAHATHSSFSSHHGPQPNNKADMQGVISALEEEFDQLNLEYRRLLSSVQNSESTAGNGTDLAAMPFPATSESIEKQAGELVNVIQKLHRKGEQLRTLKSSP